jgi:universal stress protein E
VKNGATWQDVNVLAAIDPSHRFAKPAKLDTRVLAAAAQFSQALEGTVHVMHSYVPVPAGAIPMAGASTPLITGITEGAQARAKEDLKAALADTRIPRERQHLVQGPPFETIPRLAQQLGSGLVVMGAISRSGLKRMLIGNTAERILNSLTADVLVVKPVEFKTRVVKRGRGMHFRRPALRRRGGLSVASRQVLFRAASREKVLRGATPLADAVRLTLGPSSQGRTASRWRAPSSYCR